MQPRLQILGKVKFIEECDTLDYLEGKPLQIFHSFLGASVKVRCDWYDINFPMNYVICISSSDNCEAQAKVTQRQRSLNGLRRSLEGFKTLI